MLKMIKGAQVTSLDMLVQGYETAENCINANVDADKIKSIIEGFLDMNNDLPLFLFIEIPANLKNERIIQEFEDGGVLLEQNHKDIYYLDGVSAKGLKQLLEPFYEILINDGLSAFGVGNPLGEEIGKYKYNFMMLYSQDVNKYISLFETNGISRTKNLITAWDTFTPDTPGTSEKYCDENNRDIYAIIDTLKEIGMYMAEQREE